MRVRSYLGVLLGVCLIGGLSVALIISSMHRSIDQQVQVAGAESLALAEIEQLEASVQQFLLTLDLLIANGETYLAASLGAQEERVTQKLESIVRSPLISNPSLVHHAHSQVLSVCNEVKSWVSGSRTATNQAQLLNALAVSTDPLSGGLVKLLSEIKSEAQSKVAESATSLQNRRQFVRGLTLVLILAYGCVVLLLWRWSAHHVSDPLVALYSAGKDSIENGAAFSAQPRGPTEVAEATRHLGHLVSNLELRVGQRTTELRRKNQELASAKQIADEARISAEHANKAKSEFVARMSHEIRTPMNGVLGIAELLMLSDLDDQQKSYVDTVMKSGKSLLTIVNDILDFSKIAAGKLDLSPGRCNVGRLISETLALPVSHASSKNLDIVADTPGMDNVWVHADAVRLKQVLTNLVSNAIKFTSKGEITVCASVVEKGEGDITLKVEVSDTGIGIQPNDLESVFDSFTQVDGSDSRQYGGTGLGLSICKELINLMNGTIGAESVFGEGSTFWFKVTLPLAPEPEVYASKANRREGAVRGQQSVVSAFGLRPEPKTET